MRVDRARRIGRAGLLGVVVLAVVGLSACAGRPQSTLRTDPLPPEGESAQRGMEVVRVARAYLGTPYRLGGDDADGLDCSGLVVRAYATVGVRLPRSSAALANVGLSISRAALSPGDLVLFAGDDGEVNHVGIWSGRGRFLHASSSRGVVEDALSTRWFRERYVGARRVLGPGSGR